MFYDKAKLIKNYSYFFSISVLIFSHKLTLKTVDKDKNIHKQKMHKTYTNKQADKQWFHA